VINKDKQDTSGFGPDGLTAQDHAIIADAVARHPKIERATLFGSRAMGTFGRGSDIDLAVEGRNLDRNTMTKLADELEESKLPYKVDLLLRNDDLDPAVEAHIRRHGKFIGWRWGTVESICERVTSGGTPSRSKPEFYRGGTINWFKTGELRDRRLDESEEKITPDALEQSSAKLFPPGTVLIALYGDGDTITSLGLLSQPAATNQACCAMIVKKDLADPRFLFYALKHTREDLLRLVVGGAQRNLSGKLVREHSIPIPPVTDQLEIAAVLGSLDDKIEQNRRTGRALEGLARAVFKAWFVDFAPVKAKAAGATAFPGMPAAAFAALPDRFVDSELGPVPERWNVSRLDDVSEAVKGLSYKGAGLVRDESTDSTGVMPLHNLNSVYEGGGYKNEGIKRYRGDFKERHIVLPGDLIVTNTEQGHEYRLIGFPAIVPKRFGERGLFSHHIFRVRPLPGTAIGSHFLYHAMMDGRVRDEIIGCTNGTTVNMLSADGLRRPRLCVPSATLAAEFEERTVRMYELSESLYDESRNLAALRDYLLPRLLSGKVRVKDAERQIERAGTAG
jgi:type I restriction enzyme S subunit